MSTRDLQKIVQALPQYGEQVDKLSTHVEVCLSKQFIYVVANRFLIKNKKISAGWENKQNNKGHGTSGSGAAGTRSCLWGRRCQGRYQLSQDKSGAKLRRFKKKSNYLVTLFDTRILLSAGHKPGKQVTAIDDLCNSVPREVRR